MPSGSSSEPPTLAKTPIKLFDPDLNETILASGGQINTPRTNKKKSTSRKRKLTEKDESFKKPEKTLTSAMEKKEGLNDKDDEIEGFVMIARAALNKILPSRRTEAIFELVGHLHDTTKKYNEDKQQS